MRYLLLTIIAVVATLGWGGAAGATSAHGFKLGFKSLADQIPHIAGQPLEDEHWGPNGDSLQRTTAGLMVWRKADNWTAFTNGSRTWINGPSGVQERSNDQRFSWERDAGQLAAPASISAQAASVSTDPGAAADADFAVAAEDAAIGMINQSRQQHGLAPLIMDGALRRVARSYARDMGVRNFFSHVDPDGRGLGDRLKAGGVSYGYAAENLGWGMGYPSPAESVRANHTNMMSETPPNDGHRQTILNDRIRKVGIGVYTAPGGKVYYVCNFTD